MKKIKTILALGGLATVIGGCSSPCNAWDEDFKKGIIRVPSECYEVLSVVLPSFGIINITCKDKEGQQIYFRKKLSVVGTSQSDWKEYRTKPEE